MNLLTVGKIVKPQGVKGEVKIKLYTSYSDGLKNIKTFFLDNIGLKKAITVSCRHGFAYILFEGVLSMEEAEKLRNKEVSVNKDDFKVNRKSTYLIGDVVNSKVYDEDGNFIGNLTDVENFGSVDIWTVVSDGREYSFPNINLVVKQVLPDKKSIIVYKKGFDSTKVCN